MNYSLITQYRIPKGLLATLALLACNAACKQPDTLSSTVAYKGFERPWALEFITPKLVLISEKRGRLWQLELDSKKKTEITGVPEVFDNGQGGLLDIALDADFERNKTLYFCYAHKGDKGNTTRLAKAELTNKALQKTEVLFTAQPYYSSSHHYGCRIAFDDKGLLYLSVGDRGQRHKAQSLETHNGKIIRLSKTGKIPADNPFIETEKALPEIYSYGHRNPQGLVFDSLRKRLIAIEHGPKGGDEVNIIGPGKNYGWPVISYGKEYSGAKVGEGITHKAGLEQPLHHFTPSIAPGGADIYTGNSIPEAHGDLFIAALKLQHLNQIKFTDKGVVKSELRHFGSLEQRVRDVKQSPDHNLYFVTDEGWLVRVDTSKGK